MMLPRVPRVFADMNEDADLTAGLCGMDRRTRGLQLHDFGIGEYTAASQKPDPFRRFRGKTGTAAGYHVDDQLCMTPIFELRGADIEIAVRNTSQQYILRSHPEVSDRIAHWRRTVTAAA